MPSLIRYIMYHAGIIIVTLLAFFTWKNDIIIFESDINRIVDQRILEISKKQQAHEEQLEMMASLPLALPGDEIWAKK